MPFDVVLLGDKLRRYREQLKLTLKEVSEVSAIPEPSLVAFEQGAQEPTGDEILILADLYKCDYRFFVSNEKVAPFEQTDTLYRRYGDEFSKADRWSVQEFLFLCESEEFLMRELHRTRKEFSFEKKGTYYKAHGELAASALRAQVGYRAHEVPLDVYRDLREIGLHVFRRQLTNSNISGLFLRHPVAGGCLLVNYSEDVYRQRFTAVHEAGHAILDDTEDAVVSFARKAKDLSEIRANVFASRYLMPPEFLKRIPSSGEWSPEKALRWANALKVSTEALAIALRQSELISASVEESIKRVRVPAAWKADPELSADLAVNSRKRKEALLRRGLSTSYAHLCFDAYGQGLVTAARVAEMMLIEESELSEIARLFGTVLE